MGIIASEEAIVAAEALTLRNGWMVPTKGKREESTTKGGTCENRNCFTFFPTKGFFLESLLSLL